MSAELIARVVAEVKKRDVEEIEARAARLDRELNEAGSEEQLVKTAAQKYHEAMRFHRWARNRGVFARLIKGSVDCRTESVYEFMNDDFSEELENGLYNLMNKKPVNLEIGKRTQSFDVRDEVVDDVALRIGWQVGKIESRFIQHPMSKDYQAQRLADGFEAFPYGQEKITDADKPLRIWRSAEAVSASGMLVVNRSVVYDINEFLGEVTAYQDTIVDIASEAQGITHPVVAASLVNRAAEYLSGR